MPPDVARIQSPAPFDQPYNDEPRPPDVSMSLADAARRLVGAANFR